MIRSALPVFGRGLCLLLGLGALVGPAARAQTELPPVLGGTVTLDGAGSPLVLTGNSVIDAGGVTVDLQFLVDYLVVAGGGGGASGGPGSAGGGGGGGGVLTNHGGTGLAVDARPYDVFVGEGGLGGVGGAGLRTAGDDGQDSSFGSIVATGGGAAANFNTPARPGGSGGGGAGWSTASVQPGAPGTPGQGNAGGNATGSSGNFSSGGGGGAAASGGNALSGIGGNGGDGIASGITGSPLFFGGGGGGAANNAAATQGLGGLGGGGNASRTGGNTDAAPNTGGGGGGGSNDTNGGRGGDGIVIVRYAGAAAATGGTVTTVDGHTVHSFTATGGDTLDFSPLAAGRLSAHVAGNLSGDGGIVYNGSGQVTLAGDNSYGGGTIINGGAVQAASDTALGNGGVTLNEGTLRIRPGVSLNNDISTGSAASIILDTNFTAEYLVVGGGGGGASAGAGSAGAGGGGGGVVTNIGASGFNILAQSYGVTVGEGGGGGIPGAGLRTPGESGGNSSFDGIIAIGGGGAANFNTAAQAGGSGGGGAGWSTASVRPGAPGTPGQGNAGGDGGGSSGNWVAGGGGGAGTAGTSGAASAGGNGGAGMSSWISGSERLFGGGGGGAANNAAATQGLGGPGGGGNASRTGGDTDATPNTGGGGGGGSNDTNGGRGGDGTVIVRYAGAPAATGGNITQVDGFTIHEFTQAGSDQLDFSAFDFEATLSGAITGSGGITYNGPHTLRLTGQSSYQGETRINGGTLRLDAGDQRLPATTDMILANQNNARLDLNGTSQQVASLSGGGSGGGDVSLGSGQLTVAGSSNSVFHGRLDGSGGLVKSGTGHLTLAGDNQHSGGTTLEGGRLNLATPAAAGSGPITLDGGTLGLPDGNVGNSIVINGSAANVTLNNALALDYLVVAGGGGGGSHTTGVGAGGGGAGGLLTNVGGDSLFLTSDTLSVLVGGGGDGSRSNTEEPGANGGDSALGALVALGGGGGAGGGFSQTGSPGGSGGGGRGNPGPGGSGTPGQGHDGGTGFPGGNGGGGGGGGAGGPGQNSPAVNLPGNIGFGGDGGIGRLSDITGVNLFYAGGGGAGASNAGLGGPGGGGDGIGSGTGGAGLPGTGGGGGGAGNGTGGQGGSGIVIVRYLGGPRATGGTIMAGTGSAEGYTLHVFDTVGSQQLDFSGSPITTVLDGNISGAGGFTFEGPNSLVLAGNNTYNGETRINGGHTTITGSHVSGSNSITAYQINNGARLSLTDSPNINLTGSGGLRITDGAMDMDSGSLRLGNWLTIGRDGGTGVLDMSGGTITKAGTGGVSVGGVSGDGTLNLTAGLIDVQTGITQVGSNTNSAGLLHVTGSGRLNASGGITVGEAASGDGSVRLLSGGTIDTAFLRGGAAANRSLDWDGGTLRATGSQADFLSGLTSASLGTDGGALDTGGHQIGIDQNLTGPGGLDINGGGTATLSGDSSFGGDLHIDGTRVELTGSIDQSAGSGDTRVDDGALNLAAGASLTTSAVTLHDGAVLSGAGSITTTGNSTLIGANTTLAPGDANLLGVGTLVLTTSSLTFEPGSFWELNIAGTANGRLQLDAPGNVDLGGTNLIAGTTSFDFLTNSPYWLAESIGGASFSNFANLTSTSPAAGLFPDATGFVDLGGTSFAVFMNADLPSGARTGGNDILLFATPEPSRALLAALGLAALLARRRR